jgi:hypothetical protein
MEKTEHDSFGLGKCVYMAFACFYEMLGCGRSRRSASPTVTFHNIENGESAGGSNPLFKNIDFRLRLLQDTAISGQLPW